MKKTENKEKKNRAEMAYPENLWTLCEYHISQSGRMSEEEAKKIEQDYIMQLKNLKKMEIFLA